MISYMDQWMSNANCSVCRKRFYCSHPCRKRKQFEEAAKKRNADISALVSPLLHVHKVNDQVFEALGKTVTSKRVDNGIFDALEKFADI